MLFAKIGSMAETWLRTNTRVLALAMLLPLVIGATGFLSANGLLGANDKGWMRGMGWLIVVVSAVAAAWLAWHIKRPRLAYESGQVLIYLRSGLRSGGPVRVPLDVVEGFLLGQVPSLLPGKRYASTEASAVLIRLSEQAEQWARVDVKPALGSWCNHYVTIRGTWCEPLDVELVSRLNARLAEVKQRFGRQQANR